MKKLLMIGAIGCAVVLTLAGCGGGEQRPSNSLEALKADYGFQWEDSSKPILNEKGAQEIGFHIYSSKNASAKDYNDLDIMQTLYEDTNVYVEWENVSESIYGESKTLKLGNHKGIDAIYHAGLSSNEILTYGIKRKVLLPIDEYLDYMPNFKRILNDRADIEKQVTSTDGHIYALPRVEEMGLLQNPNLLFLNKTWTKQAIDAKAVTGIAEADLKDGLTLTAEQMEAILTYFKNNSSSLTGVGDNFRPLTFVNNNWQGNQYDLYGMFGINDNTDHMIVKDGQIAYTVLDEAYFDAVTYINSWVKKGLIDQVSFEQSQDNFLANGKGAEQYGAFYWWESETVVDNPENYICCAPLKGPKNVNGHDYSNCQTVCVSNNPEISTGELIIFKDTPNVEVLLAYFDRYYMPEISAQINYGPIGLAFEEERDANGKLVAKNPPADMTTDELRLQNAPLGLCYLSGEVWNTTVEMEPRAKLRLDRLSKYEANFVPANVKPVPNLQFTEAELNTLTRYQTNIGNYLLNNLLKFTRNGVTAGDWESFKTELLSTRVGLSEVQKVYQAAYGRYASEN